MKLRYIYILTALAALAYVVLRAIYVPYTCDEAWTYTGFVTQAWWDIISVKTPVANNHILNTLLTKFASTFSISEFSLRLPNVLSYLLYAYASYKIATQLLSHKVLGILLFLALLTNHTLLEFFALSRGYGLSIGFMMMSLYHLFRFVQSREIKYAHYSLLMISIGIYASFVLLNITLFIIGFIVLYTTLYLQEGRPIGSKVMYSTKHYLVYIAFLVYLILHPILKMSNANELYYGGTHGFVSDTIGTILADYYGSFFTTVKGRAGFNLIVVAIVVVCLVITLLYAISKRKDIFRNVIFLPALILIAIVVAINIQFYYMNMSLPLNRTAMYLFPLIILMIFATMQLLIKHTKVVPIIISTGIVSLATYCFVSEMNLNYVEEWEFDRYTPTVLNDIEHFRNENGITDTSNIHVFFPTNGAFSYYILKDHRSTIKGGDNYQLIIDEVDPTPYDFVYSKRDEDVDFSKYPEFELIKRYGEDHFLYYNTKSKK